MALPAHYQSTAKQTASDWCFLILRKEFQLRYFASKIILKTYYVLGVGDIEGRERGVAEVNKAEDHFLEDLTVSSTRVGTVEGFGAAGGAQEGEGGWTDED